MSGDLYSRCSGELVWDYMRGEVICTTTGEVVDRIYDYGPVHEKPETIEQRQLLLRSRPRVNIVEKRYRRHLRTYLVAERMIDGKPWLRIDYDKLFRTGRFIHTIRSRSTDQALRNVREHGLEDKLRSIIDLLHEIDPVAVSRTERAKLALAYIILNYIVEGHPPDIGETVELFSISHTTYRRLERIARRLYGKLKTRVKAVAMTR